MKKNMTKQDYEKSRVNIQECHRSVERKKSTQININTH